MKTWLRSLFAVKPTSTARKSFRTRLHAEMLERRDVLTSSSFNATTGVISVIGNEWTESIEVIRIPGYVSSGYYDSIQVKVSGYVEMTQPLYKYSGYYLVPNVTSLSIDALGGNDSVWNYTSVPSFLNGGWGDDTLVGGTGTDTLSGWMGNDFMGGGESTDIMWGYDGNDTMWGDGGDDQIHGENDADTIYAGRGVDVAWGDGGNDYIAGDEDGDYLIGGIGNDTINGWGGNDVIWGEDGNDRIGGQDGNDSIYGGRGNDRVWGDAGNDYLAGDDNDDTVAGGNGEDTLNGWDGNDQLIGGGGTDAIYGGDGDDTLVTIDGGLTDYADGGIGRDTAWLDMNLVWNGWYTSTGWDTCYVEKGQNVVSFANYADLSLDGDNIADPIDGMNYRNFSASPLFGDAGPTMYDVDQNAIGDCWMLGTLASVVNNNAYVGREMVADFGDGTYGVRLGNSFYRVDADLPTQFAGSTTPTNAGLGQQGSLWVALVEKAYANYRTPWNVYGFLNGGNPVDAFRAFNLTDVGSSSYPAGWSWSAADELYTHWSRNNSCTICTGTVPPGSLLVANHCYAVRAMYRDGSGEWVINLRNPWGSSLTITQTQLAACDVSIQWGTSS